MAGQGARQGGQIRKTGFGKRVPGFGKTGGHTGQGGAGGRAGRAGQGPNKE
jgi:hypothetical protein